MFSEIVFENMCSCISQTPSILLSLRMLNQLGHKSKNTFHNQYKSQVHILKTSRLHLR